MVGEGLESVETLSVVPSNPEEEFWTREDQRGRGGQGGGWAYRGLVRAEGCGEGVGGRWEGSERLVLVKTALFPPRSTMGHRWEELVGGGGRGRADTGRGEVLVDQDQIVVTWG